MRIKIIGLGGVGTYLCDALCRYLNYGEASDIIVTMVDGDSYEQKNLQRQVFTDFGNKAETKKADMQELYDRLKFENINSFVNSENIRRIVYSGDIVFVCVDNHQTRKVVSDYATTLDDITIISGGNEFTDGNVQIYVRKGGIDITPSLTDYHPEIETPGDRSPEDMGCEELAKAAPQLLFTNLTVATIMCWVFYALILQKDPVAFAEIYFDLETMSVRSQIRKPVTKGVRSNDQSNVERKDSSGTTPNVSGSGYSWYEQEA